MKTFFKDFSELFKKGLRPRADMPAEGSYLIEAKNVKPSPLGLNSVPRYTRSFPSINSDASIFNDYSGIYIVTGTAFYTYINGAESIVLSGLAAGGRWSNADFRGYNVFTNGVVNIVSTSYGILSIDAGNKFPIADCLCSFRGRLILGGLEVASTVNYAKSNMIAWSEIGSLTFPSYGFARFADGTYLADGSTLAGNYTTANINTLTDRKNTGGFMPMPWDGKIYAMFPLGKAIIVYGDKGIAALVPANVDKTFTFGLKDISTLGIANQYAVTTTGREDEAKLHYFVRSDNKLFSIDEKLTLKELDYSEYLSATTSMSYDSNQEELFIATPNITYIFTKFGLGSAIGQISDVKYSDTYGLLLHSSSAIKQSTIEFKSDIISANSFGLRGLEFISLHYLSPDPVMVAIETRSNRRDPFVTTRWKLLNDTDTVKFSVLGLDFRILVKVPNYTTFSISSMRIAMQFRDRRSRRGIDMRTIGG